MKRILIAIVILLTAQLVLAEELPDTPGNRLAAKLRVLGFFDSLYFNINFAI